MIKFNKEDLIKVANLSALNLQTSEIPNFLKDIQKLLEYVEQLNEVKDPNRTENKNILSQDKIRNKNILRQDKIIKYAESNNLLKNSAKTKDNYFVVPSASPKDSNNNPTNKNKGEQ